MDYFYEPDGKVHTRFTELNRCTPGGVGRVIDLREKRLTSFRSGAMDFGKTRHQMWAEESERSGLTPECFRELGYQFPVDKIEAEYTSEIMPSLILHSRIDAASKQNGTVIDYKTAIADSERDIPLIPSKYLRSWQLKLYAYQLSLHGVRIRQALYLIEVWNRDYTKILGYCEVRQDIKFKQLAGALNWAQNRGSLLLSTIEIESALRAPAVSG